MPPSTDELLTLARHYWPASYEESLDDAHPELKRRQERWAQVLERNERWEEFRRQLRMRLPAFTLAEATTTSQASLRCAVYPAKGIPMQPVPWALVGCLSILAPVYTVYGLTFDYEGRKRGKAHLHLPPLPAAMSDTARIIARELEAHFHVTALPPEVAALPVPVAVEWTRPPQTTLFDALFDSSPTIVP
ncbi:hypothetical protein D7X55_09555 [Corallococcus sp. AB049A]|uniref:Uncharacterized protein n=1 Tax=Corallococcus interemptor TaxID=2316720 RepID=A0A3A8QR12_9BACT|nr:MULTISPECIES: hypothetical protein [Corallococcus]RKH54482.1 hypothetical protein D7Y23_00645 [Corallococcus sp. AB050B]RKH68805.1 hypothetical protein D7X96_16440 [Corallococcus interemptor]RKI70851.1 hypothetical protein D7X55_09555 [Corallococcus sp. AB049A]